MCRFILCSIETQLQCSHLYTTKATKKAQECKAHHRQLLKWFKVKLFKVHSFRFEKSVPAWLDDISFLEAVRGIKRHFPDMQCSQVSRDRYCCQCNYLSAIGWAAYAPAFKASSSMLSVLRGRRWALHIEEEKGWRTAKRDLRHLEIF